MRLPCLFVLTILAWLPLQYAAAEVSHFKRRPLQAATDAIEAFLASSEPSSELLTQTFAELDPVEAPAVLDYIFDRSLKVLRDESASEEAYLKVDALLRVELAASDTPMSDFLSKKLKMDAADLLLAFFHRRETYAELIQKIRRFDLWTVNQYNWILKSVQTPAGLALVFPAIKSLAQQMSEEQKDRLADRLRASQFDSKLASVALLKLDRLGPIDFRLFLSLAAAAYAENLAGQPPEPGPIDIKASLLRGEENEAFTSAVYQMSLYLKSYKSELLAVFQEERNRAEVLYTVFDKRRQFYRDFLRPNLEFDRIHRSVTNGAKVVSFCRDELHGK